MKEPKKFMHVVFGQQVSKFTKPSKPRPSDLISQTVTAKPISFCNDIACASDGQEKEVKKP